MAGIPTLDATITSVGADQRVLAGLAVGTSASDAAVVGGQFLPIRELVPVVGEQRTDVELPAVAVEVPAGQTLFLAISPIVDTYVGHGSIRSPGAILLQDVRVTLPVPAPADDDGNGRGRAPDDRGRPDHAGGPGGRGDDDRRGGAWWHAQVPEFA